MDNQKTFFQLTVTLTLTFDPLTSKSIGFICWSWLISLPSMRSLGQSVLKLLIGNRFSCKGHTDLDLWPTDLKIKFSCYWSETVFHVKVTLTLTFDQLTSKSIGFICWSWPIHLLSMRSLGQSVLKLLIGNRFYSIFEKGEIIQEPVKIEFWFLRATHHLLMGNISMK